MLNRLVMRIGATAAVLGAATGIVFNLLHPDIGNVTAAEVIEAATTEGIWVFDHYMIGWSFAFSLVALVVISRSFSSEPSASWGRVALPFAVLGTVFAIALVAIEGFVLPLAAEASGTEAAEAVFYVGLGLFVGAVGGFFGVTPIVFGVAILSGHDYRGWLGWAAVVVGVLGIVTATTVFFGGVTTLVQVLFGISGLLFLLWLGAMGIVLWRRAPKQAERALAS